MKVFYTPFHLPSNIFLYKMDIIREFKSIQNTIIRVYIITYSVDTVKILNQIVKFLVDILIIIVFDDLYKVNL